MGQRHSRKGQAALEYMVMISIALMIAAPIMIRAQSSIQQVETSSKASRIDAALEAMEQGARLVKSQGTPAKTTFTVTLPQGVVVARAKNNYILYRLAVRGGNQTFFRFFDFNVSGSPPATVGQHRVVVEAVSRPGEDYVNISTQ